MQQDEQIEPNFGEWMLVSRKRNLVKNGQARGTKLPQQQLVVTSKGTKGKKGNVSSLTPFKLDLTFQFKVGLAYRVVEASESPITPYDLRKDTCGTNRHNGVVRRGSCNSREAHPPNHPIQRNNRESLAGSLGMGKDTKSLVEISHKHAVDFREGSSGVEQAKATIGNAPLGRIGVRRNSGDSELYGDVEAKLGSIQRPSEEVGMEHDCINQDGV
nr:hypothetical protein CFP56_58664 [Quercus suber]